MLKIKYGNSSLLFIRQHTNIKISYWFLSLCYAVSICELGYVFQFKGSLGFLKAMYYAVRQMYASKTAKLYFKYHTFSPQLYLIFFEVEDAIPSVGVSLRILDPTVSLKYTHALWTDLIAPHPTTLLSLMVQ